jgi:hypothetical protein
MHPGYASPKDMELATNSIKYSSPKDFQISLLPFV